MKKGRGRKEREVERVAREGRGEGGDKGYPDSPNVEHCGEWYSQMQ